MHQCLLTCNACCSADCRACRESKEHDTGFTPCIMPLTGIMNITICCCDMSMLGSCSSQHCTALPCPAISTRSPHGELKTQVSRKFERMSARFQPPRSGLVSYQEADTTLSGFCAENYRLALRERSRGKHMLSPVCLAFAENIPGHWECTNQQCMVQILCTSDIRFHSMSQQHSTALFCSNLQLKPQILNPEFCCGAFSKG